MPNPPSEFSYKTYCWSLGTTSFRTSDFNRTIEEQLGLLEDFWKERNNQGQWSANENLQSEYYDFMHERGFVVGDAPRPAKDSRQKTSGLVEMGLVTNERRLTTVGQRLLEISRKGDFAVDNNLYISKDSYIYLLQLLKTSNSISSSHVRPFVVMVYLLEKFDYLTYDEFTYLAPLCIDKDTTDYIIEQISLIRSGEVSIDRVIMNIILNMDNYKAAYSYLLQNKATESVICQIGMNRKSKVYDKAYYPLFKALTAVFLNGDKTKIVDLFDKANAVKASTYWKSLLFTSTSRARVANNPEECLAESDFVGVKSESELKEVFFYYLHLFKVRKTLADYSDLNARYIKTANIILFKDDMLKLDMVPKHYFKSSVEALSDIAFTSSDLLEANCPITDICPGIIYDEQEIVQGINEELGTSVTSIEETLSLVEDERYKRFNEMVNDLFTDETLINLLHLFDSRDDSTIRSMVTDNANAPTIFEYVLGIIWYKLSGKHGKVLDYLKLSLDADLLPISHAAGGEADIVYDYNDYNQLPDHSVLIEATLSDSTNERVMEMEPVSRHLGNHLLRTGNMDSYCVFITNNSLNINLISDFRARKFIPFYDTRDYSRSVPGMKIIPLQTSDLRKIIQNSYSYDTLYEVFDSAYKSANMQPDVWYSDLSGRFNQDLLL